ncbi:acyl-CoA N-acyltransferase [Venturia nashicola]|uniref:Acyl-CoA N-acyltransferase n=1 Tax=Venturia nashicola TaxID=86259 RepID=A0A4Z1PCG0_9PEZI|nr:acyl-CoA N-acyltransferase [Venturia nashicola]TLD38409.1 acyl-CoA N-acyltransferase [Venturia nashicola]
MSVRHADKSDITAIIDILTQAFWDEDAVGRFMHPHRDRYPDDVKKYWRGVLRENWWKKGYSALVVVDDQEIVVAFAGWAFVDETPPPLLQSISQSLLTLYLKTHSHLSTLTSPNRAANPKNLSATSRALPFYIDKLPTAPRFDLETLAVHPSHQGQGYGSLLVQWGVDRATGEGVPATVICADGTEGFYETWFGRGVGRITEGVGNPLGGVRGGEILVRDM